MVVLDSIAESIKKFIDNTLKMSLPVFLTHLICAVLIIAVISIWLWKPTNDFIDKQKKKLEKERSDLVVNNRQARYWVGKLKKEKHELFFTKRAIIKAATEEAQRIRREEQAATDRLIEDMNKKASERIERMEKRAQEHIKEHIVNAAMELTEKLIDANINDANNKAIVDAYIKELEVKATKHTQTSKK